VSHPATAAVQDGGPARRVAPQTRFRRLADQGSRFHVAGGSPRDRHFGATGVRPLRPLLVDGCEASGSPSRAPTRPLAVPSCPPAFVGVKIRALEFTELWFLGSGAPRVQNPGALLLQDLALQKLTT
jgi:hypothetical protein